MRVRPDCRLLLLMLLFAADMLATATSTITICILKWKCMRSFYEWDPHERRHVSHKRVGIQMQPCATRSNIWFCYSQFPHCLCVVCFPLSKLLFFSQFECIIQLASWIIYLTAAKLPASHGAFRMRHLIIDAHSNSGQKSVRNENPKQTKKNVSNSHSYS